LTNKRVAFHTLGCKVNQSEAEAMQSLFRKAGYSVVDFEAEANVYVIHTCTVTHSGDRKSRQMIRKAIKNNKDAIVVVTGCYAQIAPGDVLKIPGVDLVIGTQYRGQIVDLVSQVGKDRQPINKVQDILRTKVFEELILEETGRVRGFIKIQEGCQNFCTYCIIPFARGPVRSRQPENIIQEANRLVGLGYQELVLTGICTGAYGQDLQEGINLNWLLKELTAVPGLLRVRISSLDPNDFTPALVETLTSYELFCPHLHISLQSGSQSVLQRMRRKYSTPQFADLVGKLREKRPGIAITTDIMVGFPGETAEEHRASLDFVKELELADLHVFKYSPRQGTKAAGFPDQVDAKTKDIRSAQFIDLGKILAKNYADKFLNKTVAVLVETDLGNNIWEGHTDNYLKVRFTGKGELRNRLLPIVLRELKDGYLIGEATSL